MRRDPRDVIIPFFLRIQEDEHKKAFEGAVKDFIDRIKKRAVEKRKEMDAERRRCVISTMLFQATCSPH